MASGMLPVDVVIEVLSRLPVKSLLRFRSVCKTWCTVIENPSFIANHLEHVTSNKNDCILVKRFLQENNKSVLSFISDETLGVIPSDMDVPFIKDEFLLLLGPCNGIVCLTNRYDIVLCNPAVREFKIVPAARFTYAPGLISSELGSGFGFDPHTNDYKIVRILELYYVVGGYTHNSVKAEIYNLNTDSWRELDAALPYVWWCPCFEPIFNGAFHWYAESLDDGHELILSFHMSTEVFQEILLPDVYSFADGKARGLAVLNESLALIIYVHSQVDTNFDIWVMNEYGVKESWTKQFTVGPLFGIHTPLSFWKYNEILLEQSNGQLVSCDLNTQNIKEFQVHGAPTTLRVVIYRESLVSIKRRSDV